MTDLMKCNIACLVLQTDIQTFLISCMSKVEDIDLPKSIVIALFCPPIICYLLYSIVVWLLYNIELFTIEHIVYVHMLII